IRYAVGGALRMEKLLKDLLAYTQAGNIAAEDIKPVDGNVVLQKALSNLSGRIQESGAEVSWMTLPTLRIHESHLLQLFQNLVGNAIKYKGTNPLRIEVGSTSDGTLYVRDNGIGIAPEYAEQLFGIFKRLHPTDRYSGTGIGLAICQKIV